MKDKAKKKSQVFDDVKLISGEIAGIVGGRVLAETDIHALNLGHDIGGSDDEVIVYDVQESLMTDKEHIAAITEVSQSSIDANHIEAKLPVDIKAPIMNRSHTSNELIADRVEENIPEVKVEELTKSNSDILYSSSDDMPDYVNNADIDAFLS